MYIVRAGCHSVMTSLTNGLLLSDIARRRERILIDIRRIFGVVEGILLGGHAATSASPQHLQTHNRTAGVEPTN